MAERNHTRDESLSPLISKQQRFLTVGPCPQRSQPVPFIRLSGLWLEHAGFALQMQVRVRVMQGCLVITAEPPSQN